LKKIVSTFLSVAFVVAMTAGVTYAWFSAQGKVRGISVSVGNSGLLINGENEWSADVNFSNIIPGWSSEPLSVLVENVSDGGSSLQLKARVLFTGADFQALSDTMLLAIEETGSTQQPDYQSLSWWAETGKVLDGGTLSSSESREYTLMFKLPTEASDEIQNSAVDLSVLLTGTQVQ
jgi:predicted ribosomally synthesized peptide with SipW-like signal peptide